MLLAGCSTVQSEHAVVIEKPATLAIAQLSADERIFSICDACPAPSFKKAVTSNDKASTLTNRTWRLHFESGSTALSDAHQASLDRFYASLPNRYQITVTGYTDDVAQGGRLSNQQIARGRAESIAQHLISLGVDKSSITTLAKPLCCYVASNTTDAGRALNRRAELTLSPPR